MEYFMKEKVKSQDKSFLKKKISKDHFIIENKEEYAGCHILLDLWGVEFNHSIKSLKNIITNSAQIAGATVLHIHLHRFGKEQGFSGVAVLAESHISIHTWPERDYIAFDIFMCGATNPQLAAKYLITHFNPKKKLIKIIKRGVTKFVK